MSNNFMQNISGCKKYLFRFSTWKSYLIVCFLVYLAGFYLSPTREIHMRWFYYTVTIVSAFMLLTKSKAIFSEDRTGNLKFILIITILLSLPFLWTSDPDYVRTLRHGLLRWLFVFSFVLATYYCCDRRKLTEKYIPLILVASASIALCLLFYKTMLFPHAQYKTGMLMLASNPNQTGIPMGVASMLCLSLWLSKPQLGWPRSLWVVLSGLFAIGVIIVETRSAMLGLFTATSVLLYIRTGRKAFIVVPAMALAAIAAFIFYHYANPVQHILPGRSAIWEHIWETFKSNPWFGGGAKLTYMVIRGPCGLCASNHAKLEAHSLYFGIAYYAGIYGIAVFLILMKKTVQTGLATSQMIKIIYLPLLVYGLTVHVFEGIYPIFKPHPFWLFTWLPILILIFSGKETVSAQENLNEI